MKIGYKASYNYTCRDQRYEVGKTYELPCKPELCKTGFHYCQNLKDVFLYYSMNYKTNVFEIEDLSEDTVSSNKENWFLYNKSATNKMKIVREIYDSEIVENLRLKHYWEKGNIPFYEEVKLLTYKAIGGYWITKIYNHINDPIFYVDSFGLMAFYKDVYGENISQEIENKKLNILYKNNTKEQIFKETYKAGHFLKNDHDLDFFKNGFQKQMLDSLSFK